MTKRKATPEELAAMPTPADRRNWTPNDWQPGEPWPTDEDFEAAGFVRFSGRIGGATFRDCWIPEDGFLEDDEPVGRN